KQASFKAYFFLRSRTIYFLECLLTDLVILSFVGLPQGDTGDGRPIGVRPSPPPRGRSFGFIADPRTVGLFPNQRERPALPIRLCSCSKFPTGPAAARQVVRMRRTSPEAQRSNA